MSFHTPRRKGTVSKLKCVRENDFLSMEFGKIVVEKYIFLSQVYFKVTNNILSCIMFFK